MQNPPQADTVEALFVHVYELSVQFPIEATTAALDDLDSKNINMLYIAVLSRLFPTSDMHHPVITPLLLMIAKFLQKPMEKVEDLVSGLFLCDLYIQGQLESKRLMPEVVGFLTRAKVILDHNYSEKSCISMNDTLKLNKAKEPKDEKINLFSKSNVTR